MHCSCVCTCVFVYLKTLVFRSSDCTAAVVVHLCIWKHKFSAVATALQLHLCICIFETFVFCNSDRVTVLAGVFVYWKQLSSATSVLQLYNTYIMQKSHSYKHTHTHNAWCLKCYKCYITQRSYSYRLVYDKMPLPTAIRNWKGVNVYLLIFSV